MSRFDPIFLDKLDAARERGTLRRLRAVRPLDGGRVEVGGRELVNLSGNDYLGLSRHPAVIAASQAAAQAYGASAGASRLVTGAFDLHARVEARIAAAKHQPAALLFASGWQANASVVPALIAAAGRDAQVFTDRLNHASLHQGCAAAGVRQIRYRHNDLDHLDELLGKAGPGPRFILTETVFSMDGDRSDVAALSDLAERRDAFLFLDEAHATGVLGPSGMGLSRLAPRPPDLVMGTFSKALGGFGAYVTGSQVLIDYLINSCSGVIFTTALPPAVVGAMDAALDLIPAMDEQRTHLQALAERLRVGLRDQGVDTGASSTQIVPAIVGEAGEATALSDGLRAAGFLAVAIRPPTVPAGSSRLRLALSAAHTADDIDAFLGAFTALRRTSGR